MKYTIGIDLGGTNIAVGLCDEDLGMIEKRSLPTRAERCPEEIVKDMATLCRELISNNSVDIEDIEYVGILAPGSVDDEMGIVEYTPNVPFNNFPLKDCFTSYFPVNRVYLANDANAAALGEALAGAGRGARSLIMITLGTGVGGGIILDGKIFSGGINSCGAELGHTVIVAGGRKCGCGRRGCWEAYSSATALKRMTTERIEILKSKGIDSVMLNAKKISARTAFDAARLQDEEGQRLVDEYIFYLATGITNMINIFQPEVVLIGGGVSGEGEFLARPLREIIDREQYTRDREVKTKIITASLGNDAGIIGAAGLGRQ